MPVKQVTSKDNPTYQQLRDIAQDSRQRRQLGQTLLDGEHLIEEAIAAAVMPRQLVVASESPRLLEWSGRYPDIPCLALPEALLRQLSPVQTPAGIMALIDIPRPAAPRGDFVVLLENIQDPGNLGSLLRTAAAAGVQEAYLSKGCAEAWSPKAMRGGQGAQFRLGLHEQADLVGVAKAFEGVVLAAVLGAEKSLHALDLRGPTAFAFGNEGAGLSEGLQAAAMAFSIPMVGGVESLNVSAAAAVCLFERFRQKTAG